jgi:hypothetical protein
VSDTDSFIEEVTEEVKRDRLFVLMRRYGWIGVLVVLGIVGGTAWREYSAAQETRAAQDFGDSILDALAQDDAAGRASALEGIQTENPGANAILKMMVAAETNENGDTANAVAQLQAVANDSALPTIYRQVASYKALVLGADALSAEDRRAGFQALSVPGQPLRLLAEEQLALLEIEAGETDAALTRLDMIAADAEATQGLRRRATQLIVALGGTPEQG